MKLQGSEPYVNPFPHACTPLSVMKNLRPVILSCVELLSTVSWIALLSVVHLVKLRRNMLLCKIDVVAETCGVVL